MPRLPRLALLGALTAVGASCDYADVPLTGPGYRCDVTNPVRQILVPPEGVLYFRIPVRESDAVQLPVIVTNRFGQPRTDVPVAFTSSDTTVVDVDEEGVLTPRSAGTATITVSSCDVESKVQIQTVHAVARTVVQPAQRTLRVGDTLTVTARSESHFGTPISDVTFTWTTSSGAVQVTPLTATTARLRAVSSGAATVTATGEGVAGSAAITVTN